MDIISNTDFLKKIKNDPNGNYLFYGEEDYLKTHAVTALRDAMGIDEALEIFNFVRIDVLDYDPDRLIDALSLPPMMAERKLVVLSGLNIKKMYRTAKGSDGGESAVGEFRALLDALAHLEEFDYNNFVLLIPSDNITEDVGKKGATGALKALSDVLCPVKFESSTPQKLALWAARHFEHHGIHASQADCAYLVEYCGKDMFTLASEIEKLALYEKAHGRDTVLREDIALVCNEEMEYGAFEFSNAILDGRRADALSILSVMKFRQIEPVVILGELSGIFSDLLKIKIMLVSGKNNYQIAQETGMNIHKVGIYAASAGKMELESIKKTVSMIGEADIAMKTRFDSGYLHIEKLICSI